TRDDGSFLPPSGPICGTVGKQCCVDPLRPPAFSETGLSTNPGFRKSRLSGPIRAYTRKVFRLALTVACVTLFSCNASAQWVLQESRTTADLRGVDSVNEEVAWASGPNGIVLRTT